MPTDTYLPAVAADDGYVRNDGTIFTSASPTYFGSFSHTQIFDTFFRFPAVTLAQGETISSASLQLNNGADNYHSGSWQFTVCADAADSSTQVASYADLTGRAVTTSTVTWTPTTWTGYTSVDVTAIVQEIVNRAGWVSGNALQIFVKDATAGDAYTTATTREATGSEPKLVVTHGAVAPPRRKQPVVRSFRAVQRASVI